jgi:uncharacterized protein
MFKTGVTRNLASLALGLIICLAAVNAFAQDSNSWNQNVSPLPSPTAPVNDYAGVIDDATEAALNKRLIEYQRTTGVELAVAAVRTTDERPIFDYSLAVARGWGVGSKSDDNPSALLFVAIDDRKYFTQVSKDLEDELPDGLVGNIQRQYLVPEFKKGNYAKGISDTLEAYIRAIDERSSGSAAPTPAGGTEISGEQGMYSTFCCLVIIGVILLIIFANRGGRSGKGGGGWGGGFGGGGSALPWIIGSVISNAANSSSSSSGWGGGGSSSWGGGGSDWGGFGGGGDFGGGGAGGDW